MSWHDWLVNEMIPGADKELQDRVNSVASVTAAKTHWEHWQAIYLGIQGTCKPSLEGQLATKRDSFYNAVPSWQSSHSYTVGDVVRPTTPNGYVYECTQGGTSGGSQPTWPTSVGSVVYDPLEEDIHWTCGVIEIQYGTNYNVTNISDWNIKRRITTPPTEGTVLYHYLGTGWDGNATIIKDITDWNTMYPLLTDSVFGANSMVSNLSNALTIMTNWKNAIQNRNPILGDYV